MPVSATKSLAAANGKKSPAAAVSKTPVVAKKVVSRKAKSNSNNILYTPREPDAITMPDPDAEIPKSRLSAEEVEEFKQVLMIKRAELQGDIETLNKLQKNRQESAGDLSTVPFHPADAGSDTFEQDFAIGLMDNEQSLLKEINQALGRINDGTYGICVATHKPITKTRLQATPWAKFCIEYARLLEKGQAPRFSNYR